MTDPFVMQDLKSFQNLFCDLRRVHFRRLVVRHVSAHVTLADILSCKEYFVFVFEPAKELDKQVAMLEDTQLESGHCHSRRIHLPPHTHQATGEGRVHTLDSVINAANSCENPVVLMTWR